METIDIDVDVKFEDGQEDTVEVEIDIEKFTECEDKSEQIEYIKKRTKKQYNNVKKVNFTNKDLKEVQSLVDDICDTSDWHPNETYEEFMEHEYFD